MRNNDQNQMVTVRFEPSGWRGLGDGMSAKSLQQAHQEAIMGAIAFISGHEVKQGKVYGIEGEGQQSLYVELPGSLVKQFQAQPFVGREYPDQVKSTLQVLPRRMP